MPRAPKVQPPKPVIVCDTREQSPWSFSDAVETVVGTLHTGDYSLLGFEGSVCVERKSLNDWVQTIIHERERFERELARMATFDFRCVIVEGSYADVRDHLYTSQAHPSSVFGLSVCLMVDYGVPVLYCHDRAIASRVAERILRRWFEKHQEANA